MRPVPDRQGLTPDADVLEGGDRPPRRVVWTVVAALLAGAVAGYLVGAGTRDPDRTAAPATSSAPADYQPVEATGERCAAQVGDRLQLGVEVRNPSPAAATMLRADAVLPLGGLRQVAQAWGTCGRTSSDAGPATVPPNGTSWLTLTFEVEVPCPVALPVGFTVTYERDGGQIRVDVSGFADLGDVTYSRCPAPS